MKRIFLILIVLVPLFSFAQVQYGGTIHGQNNSGTDGVIKRNLDALKVFDSAVNARLLSLISGINVSNFPASFNIGNFPVMQPVSGTFWQATQPVSIASMPSTPVTGTFWQATQPVSGSFWQTTQPISAASLPLPSNASQETGGNLAAIKTDVDKIPSQGQALAAASMPVVLTAAQITTLTPVAAITNYANETGGNLALIKADVDKLPALGQTTKAGSQPVVQASDQLVLQVTGQSAQTATVNNILTTSSGSAATDVSQYRSFAVQVVSTGSGGTFIFEGSVDNTNFVAIQVQDINPLSPGPLITAITASSSNKIYVGACPFPYLRLRIATTITGGSIQAFSAFSPNPLSLTQLTVAQGAASNLNTLSVIGANAAAAETTTNPTTGVIRSVPLLFNGVSWDRQHGNWNTTTGDAGAKTTTFNGATQTNYDSRGATITVLCGTVSGSTPTMTGQLQWSPDAGTTWINYGAVSGTVTTTANTITFIVYPTNSSTAGATPAALVLGSTQSVQINGVLPRTWRIVYTITGSSPSFAITAVYVNYQL